MRTRRNTGIWIWAMLISPVLLPAQSITLRVGDSSRVVVAPGARLSVPVNVDLSAAATLTFASMQGTLSWSASRLRLDSVRTANPGLVFTANLANAANGAAVVSTFSSEALATSGPIMRAFFTAASETGGTRIQLVPSAVGNAAGANILANVRLAPLNVCVADPAKWGDVNDDGVANIIDAQQIARYSVGLSVANPTVITSRGDVTADGQINIIDAQQVARFSVGLNAVVRLGTTLVASARASSLTLTPNGALSVVRGLTLALAATPRDSTGADLTGCTMVTWSSGNPAVATVSSDGVVTAVGLGLATILASSGGVTQSVTVTVRTLSTLSIASPTGEIAEVDRNLQLTASEAGSTEVPGGVIWRTDAPGRATVTASGIIQGHAPGPVVVTAISSVDTTVRTSVTLDVRWPVGAAASAISVGGTTWPWEAGLICALQTGRAYCWGYPPSTGSGLLDLSDNVRVDMVVSPRAVNSTDSFAMLSAGASHACGLTVGRAIRCWGGNEWGALGRGSANGSFDPASPSTTGEWVQVTAGLHSTCALDRLGRAWCWGFNVHGAVGNGTLDPVLSPTLVTGGQTWRSVVAGWNRSCGITTAARLFCWGFGYGSTPQEIGVGRAWASAYPGDGTSCAITTDGELRCWSNGIEPVAVATTERVLRVDLGSHHGCALTVNQSMLCWGEGQGGNLGRWTAGSTTPIPGPAGPWRAVATGDAFETCGIRSSGDFYCWGMNKGGRLGLGIPALPGIRITTPSQIVQEVLGGGNHHRCVLLVDGSATCSGWNHSGQLGSVVDAERRPGHTVSLNAIATGRFLSMAPVYDYTFALTSEGALWGWGGSASPPQAASGSAYASQRWKGIWDGGSESGVPSHRCLLSESGEAWCEGANAFGQLGRGSASDALEPLTAVSGGRVWRSLALGGRHSCGIDSNGTGWCWGRNEDGQLGDGTTTDRSLPTQIAGGSRWLVLSAAGYGDNGATTCGIREDRRAYCWGRGPLGDGSNTNNATPVAVGSSSQAWLDISVGPTHRCATTTSREVWCWGRNLYGETQPVSTAIDLFAPTRISGVAADRVSVIGRAFNSFVWAATCAWSSSAPYLACWGDNHLGLVDPSSAGYRGAFAEPQRVLLP